MNTCTCLLSHSPYQTPFITPFVTPLLELYFSCGLSRGFPIESLRHQCNQGGQTKTFWRSSLKQIIKWRQVNNCKYTVLSSFTVTLRTPGVIQISYQSKQWRFVLTKDFHFYSIIISDYKKLRCFCVGLF